jgi:cell division protein FtsL
MSIFMVGAIGAYTSFLRVLKDAPKEKHIEMMLDGKTVVASTGVGGILAVLAYSIFCSGVLTNEIFPNFKIMNNDYTEYEKQLGIFERKGGTAKNIENYIKGAVQSETELLKNAIENKGLYTHRESVLVDSIYDLNEMEKTYKSTVLSSYFDVLGMSGIEKFLYGLYFVSGATFAKMIIYAFIAGWHQNFVIGMLDKFIEKESSEDATPEDAAPHQ